MDRVLNIDNSTCPPLDWWLHLLEAPTGGPLTGLLARCIFALHERFPDILSAIATPPDLAGLSPYLRTQKETTGRIAGAHDLSGRLADAALYALYTPAQPTDRTPALDVIRVLLLALRYSESALNETPGKPSLPPTHIAALSSLVRNLDRAGEAAREFWAGLPVDGEPHEILVHWGRAFRVRQPYPGCPKSHAEAVRALLDHYGRRLGRVNQERRRRQRERVRPHIERFGRRLAGGGGRLRGPVLLVDGPSPAVPGDSADARAADASDGLAPADIHDTITLLSGEPCPADDAPAIAANERASVRRDYEVWSERLFARFSDSVLTDDEAARCWAHLCLWFDEAAAAHRLPEAEAALLTLMMLVTARSEGYLARVACLGGQPSERIAQDETVEGIDVDAGIHLFAIPGRDAFWKAKEPLEILRPSDTRVRLALPEPVAERLRALRALQVRTGAAPPGERLFHGDPDTLHTGVMHCRERLRDAAGVPRASLERLRQYLPVCVYQRTRDPLEPMLLSGQELGLRSDVGIQSAASRSRSSGP